MTTPVAGKERAGSSAKGLSALWLAPLALAILCLPGCGGCVDDPITAKQKEAEAKKKAVEEKKKADKEKDEKDFEIGSIMQALPAGEPGTLVQLKPGHWYATTQQFKRNKGDFQGELTSYVGTNDAASDRPLPLDDAPYRLKLHRPAVLAKKQAKAMEMLYYLPRKCTFTAPVPQGGLQPLTPSKTIYLYNRLVDRTTGFELAIPTNPFRKAPSHQYELVVLSGTPDRYGSLRTLHSVEIKGDSLATEETAVTYYQVIMPKSDKRVALPSHPLAWTAVAYILWDDLDPSLLTPEQQDALVDWLHWGGQIIVSGPGSIAALRSSFLGPYLPVTDGKPGKLSQERLTELSNTWTLPEGPPNKQERRGIAVVPEKEPEGLEFTLQGDGVFTPGTGSLVAERQVGRGRIAITSFSLAAREIVNWPSFDNFVNGCLLRRPGRTFTADSRFGSLTSTWANLPGVVGDRRLDPRDVTQLRYWSRDMGDFQLAGEMASPTTVADEAVEAISRNGRTIEFQPRDPTPRPPLGTVGDPTRWETSSAIDPHRGFLASAESGIAGWNDFSGVAHAARASLKDAAGIKVPERTFVVQLLLVYLAVLVPLNWGFFKLMGRVEWAWAAAPVIAVAGAFTLVRVVQLDIGFVRSRTELGVLEIQDNHPRGHLTRYTALYTSLTTGYENSFSDPSALVLPFATGRANDQRNAANFTSVDLRRDEAVTLRGFQVDSNATGLIHSEQMLPLGGGIEMTTGGSLLKNGTSLTLKGAGLVRRNAAGEMEVAWLGELKPGESKLVTFKPPADANRLFPEWEQSKTTQQTASDDELSVRRVLNLAQDPRSYAAGDLRLLAWTDQELGTVTYNPGASQNMVRTLVLCHLKYAPLPPPASDVNMASEIKRAEE